MSILYLTCGIPGSGKSFYAAKLAGETNSTIVCPDTLRQEICGDASDMSQDSYIWGILVPRLVTDVLAKGNGIFDATMLNPKARKPIINLAKKCGAEIHYHYFEPDVDRALRQNQLRMRKVPEDVISSMAKRWAQPSCEEGLDFILNLDKVEKN